MGLGDNLLASGLARGAAARGKRVAFGDGKTIIWDQHSETIFRGNPNIAPPGSEADQDLEWINFYRGNRIYNRHDHANDRWEWNYKFKPAPGEIYFTGEELRFAASFPKGFVLIEPNVPEWKSVAPNKQWPVERYAQLTRRLFKKKYEIRQLIYGPGHRLIYAKTVKTKNFRQALAVMSRAALYVGPEGGLHHGAAALGIPAVVLFGGFIPPQVTGYDTHTNLTGGARACGSLRPCEHCRQAMDAISVDEVLQSCIRYLSPAARAISEPISASG